jgi:hypothetical protein
LDTALIREATKGEVARRFDQERRHVMKSVED